MLVALRIARAMLPARFRERVMTMCNKFLLHTLIAQLNAYSSIEYFNHFNHFNDGSYDYTLFNTRAQCSLKYKGEIWADISRYAS